MFKSVLLVCKCHSYYDNSACSECSGASGMNLASHFYTFIVFTVQDLCVELNIRIWLWGVQMTTHCSAGQMLE